ncbi:MAG TPA: hypothetical protein VHA52_05450 [Candidatus Babeliaceae bacterium]|nr:hypothetical protein [Candidatus Babeliaceae bacterium]
MDYAVKQTEFAINAQGKTDIKQKLSSFGQLVYKAIPKVGYIVKNLPEEILYLVVSHTLDLQVKA